MSREAPSLAIGRRGLLTMGGAAALAVTAGALPAEAKPLKDYGPNSIVSSWTKQEIEDALDAFFDSSDGVLTVPPMDLPLTYERELAHGTNKAIIFEPGARLYMPTFTAPVITLYTEPLWTENVSTIAVIDNVDLGDNPGVDPATVNTVAQLTIAAAHPVRKGDRFRLVSDDEVYESLHGGYPPGNARRSRIGEVVTAGVDSTGTTITLTSPLKEPGYATTVRLAALAQARVDLIGGTCDYADSAVTTSGIFPVIQLEGLTRCHIVGFEAHRTIATVFQLFGCLDTQVVAPVFQNGRNEPSRLHLAYGVLDNSGVGTTVVGFTSLNVRHAVDTGTWAQEANSTGRRIHRYGRTRGLSVSGGSGSAGSNSPTSTHDEVDGATVTGVAVLDTYQGANSAGPGFTMRGKNTALTGCRSSNTRIGLYLATYAGGTVDNCEVLDCQTRALMFNSGSVQVQLDTNGTISDSRFSVLNSESPVWYVSTPSFGASMHGDLNSVVLAARSTRQQTYARVAEFNAPGRWRVQDLTIDLRDLNPTHRNGTATGLTGATGIVPFWFGVDGVTLEIDTLRILAGQNSIARLFDGAPAALPNTQVRIRDIVFDGDQPITQSGGVSGANKFGISWSRFTSGQVFASGRVSWGTGGSLPYGRTNEERTSYLGQTAAASGVPALQGVADDQVTLRFGGTAGNVTMSAWPTASMRPGQYVTIRNDSNGSVTFPLPARTVPAGAAATFVLSDSRNPVLISNT